MPDRYCLYILMFILCGFSSPLNARGATKTEVIAAVMVGEAGGEKFPGMQAVLNVLQNRTDYRKNISSLYYKATKKWQFSAYNRVSVSKKWTQQEMVDHFKRHPKFNTALALLKLMQQKRGIEDVTGGATHYINPRFAKPSWAPPAYGGTNKKAKVTTKIGNHVFFKDVD